MGGEGWALINIPSFGRTMDETEGGRRIEKDRSEGDAYDGNGYRDAY